MPYSVLIRGVLDALGDSLVVSDSLTLDDVHLGGVVFTPITAATFDATLTNVGEGIIALGRVEATFRTTCVRCLRDFESAVVGEIDGFFVRPEDEAGLPDEQERDLIADDRIDLEPVVLQSLVVDLPFAPLHSADCAGICAICGEDLNERECACLPEASLSPFAKLREAFPDVADAAE